MMETSNRRTTTAADLAGRLGLRRASTGWYGDCPACGYRKSFCLREKAGVAQWICFSCQDRAALTHAIIGNSLHKTRGGSHTGDSQNVLRQTANAMRLWQAAKPLAEGPVRLYLSKRGLSPPNGSALRYLDQAHHPSGAKAACMIALVVDVEEQPKAVHRTYIAVDGTEKAPLDPARATLGPVSGGVVRLCELGGSKQLVIGEGIESALSAGVLVGVPAWAALSAGNMAKVQLPESISEVLIAADHDAPGERGAWAAADAFFAQGRRVRVLRPDRAGDDFNDILRRSIAQGHSHG